METGLNKGLFSGLESTFRHLLSMEPQQIMASSAPEFLKVAAMQQQGKAREAMMEPAMPSTTVAEDVVQQSVAVPPDSPLPASEPALAAAPYAQGGLLGLEVSPDLYSDQYYGGAHLPYYNEGYTPDYAQGGVVGLDVSPDLYGDRYAIGGVVAGARAAGPFIVRNAKKVWDGAKWVWKNPKKAAVLGLPALIPGDTPIEADEPETTEEPTPDGPIPGKRGALFDWEQIPEDLGVAEQSAGIPSLAPLTPQKALPAAPQLTKREQYDMAARMQERDEFQRRMGVDPEFFDKQRGEYEADEVDLQDQRRRDGWLALTQAGLTMMQTPGNFGQALATGAERGLGAFNESESNIRQEMKELRGVQRQLDAAEQAQARGDAQAEMAYKQAAEAEYRNAINEQAKINFELDVAQAEFEGKQLDREQTRSIALFDANTKFAIAEMTVNGSLAEAESNLLHKLYELRAKGLPTGDKILTIAKELEDTLGAKDLEPYLGGRSVEDLSPRVLEEIKQKVVAAKVQTLVNTTEELISRRNALLRRGASGASGFSMEEE